MESILVLIRHGESEWNARNVWTGLTDVNLTEKGRKEAAHTALLLKDIRFDAAFTSMLKRANETLDIILGSLHQQVPVFKNEALNERDYGIFTGKNKTEIKKQLGDENFLKLRRGWDYPIENGESLKQVYDRVSPYFDRAVSPLLSGGKHVLIVAHGNSLRALIKKLDQISDEDIPMVELATGEAVVYTLNEHGSVISHNRRHAQPSE